MRKSKQQEETLTYFKKHVKHWNEKAKLESYDHVNVIRQRMDYVLSIIKEREETKLILDVGCGSGDLVIEIAKRGINAIGIDFAEEMIKISKDSAKKAKMNKTEFICDSIFNHC